MTKKDLIDRVMAKNEGMRFKDAELVVNTLFDSIIEALASEDKVEIRGFGSFKIRERKAREGRNPRSGQKVRVKAKKAARFKAGKELKERVDG
ncbi:MAG TPA: HU family DNA-binding protein [bacterium]|nr:HU family DNA-binding protein [bacterium]